MVKFKRWLKHAFMPPWSWRLSFPVNALDDIENAIRDSETQHRGELRFAIENALAPSWVWHGMTPHQRAAQVFSNLRVWDTEENSGVLVYVNLADRCVVILADRGIHPCVAQAEWERVASLMRNEFKHGRFQQGSLKAIADITDVLTKHFPADSEARDELPNRPVIVKR